MPAGAGAVGASRRWVEIPTVLLVLLAVSAGGAVAVLGELGVARQSALILALGLGLPALLLFLIRPHTALLAYLLVLPLMLPAPVFAGLNAGETLTLGVITLGAFSLWGAPAKLGDAVRALAPVVGPLLLLGVVSVVSLLVNGINEPEQIASGLFKVLAFGLVALLVYVHADSTAKVETLMVGVLVGALVVAIYAVIAYVAGWSYSAEYDWNRASGTFEHWNQLGGFMALMSMPTLGLAVSSKHGGARLLFGVAFGLEITALLLSLTLGSILALVLAVAISMLFIVRVSWTKLAAAAFLMLTSFAVVFATNELLRDKLLRFDERVMDRLRTYAVGVSMFRDRFWFGFGSEQRLLDELWFGEADYGLTIFGASSSIPHNAFLLIGVEKGFFGALFFGLLILGALRMILRHRHVLLRSRWSLLYQGLVVGVLAFLIQNLTNDLALHARIGIVFFAMIALGQRIAEAAQRQDKAYDVGSTAQSGGT